MAATPDLLQSVFAPFAAVSDPVVQYWLDRAALIVTADWNDDHAQMLLACHYMVLNGLGSTTEAQTAGMIGVTSMKSGTLSLNFGGDASAAVKSGYDATQYGRQFKPLLLARVGGPRIADSGVVCFDKVMG